MHPRVLFFSAIFLTFVHDCVVGHPHHEASKFIASWVPQANERNPENVRNVVIVRLDRGPIFELFDEIVKGIMQACPQNPVIIKTDEQPFEKNVISSVSFLIVTVDFLNPVLRLKKQ